MHGAPERSNSSAGATDALNSVSATLAKAPLTAKGLTKELGVSSNLSAPTALPASKN